MLQAMSPIPILLLLQAVTHHPVGVGICVGPYIIQWRAYTGGVFDIDGEPFQTLLWALTPGSRPSAPGQGVGHQHLAILICTALPANLVACLHAGVYACRSLVG